MAIEKMMKIILYYINKLFGGKKEVDTIFETFDKKLTTTKKDKKDKRDVIYIASAQPSLKKYTIPNLPEIRNQGQLNSCASFAATACIEIQMSQRRFMDGSERFHYYHARKFINKTYPGNVGMTVRDSCKTVAKYGFGFEMLCPYDMNNYNNQPSQMAYVFSKLYPIEKYEALYDIKSIKTSIENKIPVICGIFCNNDFFKLNYKNYKYKPTAQEGFGHAVNIVGFNDERKVFFIRNSWGFFWGKRGYFEMPYSNFKINSFSWWRMIMK